MAQHDYNLANQSGADFRADLNNALSAIATTNSGATSPSTTFAHQLWVDTANSVLKIRNSANDAWITTGVSITADNTFTGNITGNASTATALETARTINGASFDGTANISFDTDSVSEGSSNLYFTNARVESYLDAGTSTPTFASAVINSSLTGSAVLDDDTFATASATTVATSESIKAYVDSQVGSVDTLAEILLNGNTTGGTDIEFGDNDKAIFGTGSDLQIYHNGLASFITDVGTGDLFVRASNSLKLQSADNENYLVANANGAVTLYYNNAPKAATTNTGIDVTGNITSTASTGNGTFNLVDTQNVLNAGNKIAFFAANRSNADEEMAFIQPRLQSNSGGAGNVQEGYLDLGTSGNKRITIQPNGDISFYDDTGSTQSLFWDASAESLGIGTSSPNAKLTVQNGLQRINSTDGSSDARIQFSMTDGSNVPTGWVGIPSWNKDALYIFGPTANGNESAAFYTGATWVFQTGNTERARIDDGGRLLVGTTSIAPYASSSDTAQGIAIRGDFGLIGASRPNNYALSLNRADSDGEIVNLRKSGSTVGEIGTNSGYIRIGTGDTHLLYHSGIDTIIPYSGSANRDDAISLGYSGARFKDLHLSGTANVGLLEVYHATTDTVANFESGDNSVAVNFTAADNSMQIATSGTDGIVKNNGAGSFRLFNNGSERARIDSSGRLGIGTTSPSYLLHIDNVGGGDGIALQDTNDAGSTGLHFLNNSGTIVAEVSGLSDNTGMTFETAGSEKARIDSSGNLLVGTTNTFPPSDSGNEGVAIKPDNIAISRNASTALFLDRMTSDGIIVDFRKDNTVVGSISVTSSATAYNTSSDARLKNITGQAKGLEVITKLNPVAYNWKADGKADEGLIAQEVKEILSLIHI